MPGLCTETATLSSPMWANLSPGREALRDLGPSERIPAIFRLKQVAPIPLIATTALCGCGGCGNSGRPAASSSPQRGGRLLVVSSSDVDSLDPGQANLQFTSMILGATQRTLYTFDPLRRVVRPDLAAAQPRVSRDLRTVTVSLRPGVHFGPPVNRAVTADDEKYALERAFRPNVGNGYAATYFGALRGIERFLAGRSEHIAGIEARGPLTVVLHLSAPTGAIVSRALVTLVTSPVPRDYAARFDGGKQSTYRLHTVATGPYMVRRYDPARGIELVRNPNWDPRTDRRPAYADTISVRIGTDPSVASQQVLDGNGAVSADLAPPPGVLHQALRKRARQVVIVPNDSTSYVTLNTSIPPFNNVNLRRAVVAGFDREALRKVAGGESAGTIATHFLPPTVPGFAQAGGARGPAVDFARRATGDRELAARYLRRAGFPDGRYHGRTPVEMVGSTDPLGRSFAEVAQAQLGRLGFSVHLRLVAPESVATKFCTVPAAHVSSCPSWGWQPDFPDGQAMLVPTFGGASIGVGSPNASQFHDTQIDAAMERATAVVDPHARARAWAAVDKMLTAAAPAVPGLWNNAINLRSANVRGVINPATAKWDLSYTAPG
jgi:peptide/nickel transport system substrate-binding protein